MEKIPLFIHINSCAGRYIRDKLSENYNNNFIIYHINPTLYQDNVDRDKLIRCWKYKDYKKLRNICLNNSEILEEEKKNLKQIFKEPPEKYYNVNVNDFSNSIPFTILNEPVKRYKIENKNIKEPLKDVRSYNIMCKSLYIAFTGDVNELFLEFNEDKYNRLLEYIKNINVLTIDKINELANLFKFDEPLVYNDDDNNDDNDVDNDLDSEIRNANYFDCKLYNLYK